LLIFTVCFVLFCFKVVGVTEGLARAFAALIGPKDTSTSIVAASVWMGFSSALTCQILNNQPMTILFTKIIQEPAYLTHVGPVAFRASMYAIIMGSNLGGSLTVVGALAGIMWISILRSKGFQLTSLEFAKYGFITIPPVILIGTVAIAVEHIFFARP
jgi:Na+/H+ antiporter NhaD/arsenite permease-like protein